MQCPVCTGPMYDNRTNKKNPKAPDYKCKDKNCKYELDRETGEYVPSEYGTAVWLPKGQAPRGEVAKSTSKPTTSNGDDIKTRAMVMAYAKDLVMCMLNNQTQIVSSPQDKVVEVFKVLWAEVARG